MQTYADGYQAGYAAGMAEMEAQAKTLLRKLLELMDQPLLKGHERAVMDAILVHGSVDELVTLATAKAMEGLEPASTVIQ